MSTITIYHGSDHVIEKPIYGAGKRNNDYGLGFYCTESVDMAKEWAATSIKNGVVNSYLFDVSDLRVLSLQEPKFTTLHWLTLLLENREFSLSNPLAVEAKSYLTSNFHIDTTEYDVIVGYRADDSYFSFARGFLNGSISYDQLAKAMKLGDLGLQVVLKSPKAFTKIVFSEAEQVDSSQWYPKRMSRDNKARQQYFRMAEKSFNPKALYITDILRQEVKSDDARL